MVVSRKHLLALRRAWTCKKIANMILCETELLTRKTRLRSKPYIATIDLTSVCNLSCPGCPTGRGRSGRARTKLHLEHLEMFIAELSPYFLVAHLYNWGEPFLHHDVAHIIRRLSSSGVFTSLSSHLSLRAFERIRDACAAGLDHLIVSVDGTNNQNYNLYRKGGDFELVIANLRRLVNLRDRTPGIRTRIEWQFIAFDHVSDQTERARMMAKEIGVDWFRVIQPWHSGVLGGSPKPCRSLWRNIVLQADGGLAPCCKIFDKDDDFGDLAEGTAVDLRNCERAITARSLMVGGRMPEQMEAAHPCLRCPLIRSLPHLQPWLESHPIPNNDVENEAVMGLVKAPLE